MQSIHSSFSVKTFALAAAAAGGDSGSKKTRNRRSKEERKTMVESFIKKYQNTNCGKFPSLNLTHKEVGGSFYTVREIVREIIQENRVLAPGNLNSKALNLAYYLEEEDISTPMSIATIDNTTGQEQRDDFSFKDGDYVNPTHSKIIEVDNDSVHQASLQDFRKNVTMVPQQVHGEKYECVDDKLDNDTVSQEPNLDNETEVVVSGNPEFISAQIFGNSKHSVPSCESMVRVVNDNGNQSNGKAPIINSLSASNVFLPVPDDLSEANLSVESASDFSSSIEASTVSDIDDEVKEKFVPLGVDSVNDKPYPCQKTLISNVGNGAVATCPDAQTSFEQDSVVHTELSKNIEDSKCGSKQVSGKINHSAASFDSMVSNISDEGDGTDAMATEVSPLSSSDLTPPFEAPKKCYFVDVKEVMPPGVELNIDRISESVLVSSNIGDETLAACHGTEHSRKRDPIIANNTENTEISSTIVADEASNENLNLSVLQSFDSKELESIGSVVSPSLHADNMGNVVTRSFAEASQFKDKVEKHNHCNSSNVANTKSIPRHSLPRQSLDIESDKTIENPFWAAIKSIINAVSKFWSQ